jgi:site-specific DNA-methyltransferase (adenine-specific)
MNEIDDKSIDLILCDLPYAITGCNWDTVIPFDQLWNQYERIIKTNGTIVLTASQPFTSQLVMSNAKLFRYEWIWEKNINSNFQNAKNQPLKHHESVLVFYKKKGVYNPQGLIELDKPKIHKNRTDRTRINHIDGVTGETYYQTHTNYPKSVFKFDVERGLHATQKPVALFEYLIKTYTNEGAIVLDNCAGSCTTAIACLNTNRNFICIEKDEHYYNVGVDRVRSQLNLL